MDNKIEIKPFTVYPQQRELSDKHIQEVKKILKYEASHFVDFEESNIDKDTQEATDIILKPKISSIAVRVREPNCYFKDFTIRSRSNSGGLTELDKLKKGFADIYIYCWTNSNNRINEYIIIDLHEVRKCGLLEKNWREISNTTDDGRTKFITIPIYEVFKNHCIVSECLSSDTKKRYLAGKY